MEVWFERRREKGDSVYKEEERERAHLILMYGVLR